MKAKQLTVYVPDAVGTLAHVARTLADSKVNITGLICVGTGDRSPIRLLVNSPARAKKALQAQGLYPTEEDVLVVALPDKPGRWPQSPRSWPSPASILITHTPAAAPVGK